MVQQWYTKIESYEEVTNHSRNMKYFSCLLREDWEVFEKENYHVIILRGKIGSKELREIENVLILNGLGDKMSIKLENEGVLRKMSFVEYKTIFQLSKNNLNLSYLDIPYARLTLHNPLLYWSLEKDKGLKNKEVTAKINKLNFRKTENIIEAEIDPIPLVDQLSGSKVEPKKLIFKGDSSCQQKLEDFHELIEYNLQNGEKSFTVKKIENYVPILYYNELEFNLVSLTNLTLQGTLTKPTTPLPNQPPPPTPPPGDGPNGPNGPINDLPQLISEATTAIQTELNKSPTVADSELGSHANWKTALQGLTTETDITNFKTTLISAIEAARTKKQSGTIEQAINNLTDKKEKARAKELWRKLLAGEDLVKEGKFKQKIYDPLLAEKQSNSNIYQILNQQGRLDKLLTNLSKIAQREENNGSNNQQNQENDNSSIKWIIGGAITLIIFIIVAIAIWTKKKKK